MSLSVQQIPVWRIDSIRHWIVIAVTSIIQVSAGIDVLTDMAHRAVITGNWLHNRPVWYGLNNTLIPAVYSHNTFNNHFPRLPLPSSSPKVPRKSPVTVGVVFINHSKHRSVLSLPVMLQRSMLTAVRGPKDWVLITRTCSACLVCQGRVIDPAVC